MSGHVRLLRVHSLTMLMRKIGVFDMTIESNLDNDLEWWWKHER